MVRGFFLFSLLILLSCTSQKNNTGKKIENIFQSELAKENIHNAFLSVHSPSQNINWNFAEGQFQNSDKVTPENPFYCASIGKTITATAIAILVENGHLNFNDEIREYLPNEILDGLHVFEGIEYSYKITVAQLLQHTSGLPDYFEGKTADGSPNGMQLIFQDSTKFWAPADMIELSKKMKPLFTPGNGYNYSDTEYVLLGLIIENISQKPLHDFFRKEIFEPLQMNHTSLFLRSESIKNTARMAEIWVGNFHIGEMTSLSADWAGGGLVSTGTDLNRFLSALNSGKIISESTLQKMKNWVAETRGMYYGFGIRKIDFRELFHILPGIHIEGHSGTTSSFMFYCPQLDIYMSGTFNQSEEVQNSILFMTKILSILKRDLQNE